MDEQLILEERDIKSIISECGDQALSEPCLYNISILNYLLEFDHIKAGIMIQSLIQFGEDEIRFLQAYLSGENKHTELIKKITLETVEVLEFLINQVELNNELRLSLISTALEHLNSELEYSIEDSVSKYLQEHYFELNILLSSKERNQAENIAKLYSNASIRVAKLKPLSEQIRNAFIAKDLYEINVENLKIVLGNETDLALDVALEKDQKVYYYLLRNLERYLNAVDNNFNTVTSNEYLIKIIDDVSESENHEKLGKIIRNSSPDCIIQSLDVVRMEAWIFLASCQRFTATFNNISSYISINHGIDEYLERILIQNDAIVEHESATQEEKEKLTINILNANNLSAEHKVQLVNSLNLDNYIESSTVPKEMLPLLLESDLVEDCEDTYEHLLEEDWSTREHYIEASNKFHEYITPELLQGDLEAFLASTKITIEKKMSIVEQAIAYTEDCDKGGLVELAQFAINQDKTLPIDVIEKMASHGIEDQSIIKLLHPQIKLVPISQLINILTLMKADYPKLTAANGKTAKVPNNEENKAFLQILKNHELVSSFPPTSDPILKVYMKGKSKN
ncbi:MULTISPECIES: hypothetical protein [Marinomonas]|uniref:Uncharacterized protein n=1 Tax=Marinomonas rhodophyticola TaxID=2992803 RepID=A0ABT3KDP6_9GAMM|nr:hypothetical protein [Marinomonas sp. KJ51-3]MCW4628649.1 hypothetical protein [Marinomonas sp. KJ51-3]